MPSISFLPPEAESPVAGSNTPILTTLSPLLSVDPEPEPELEQPAARAKIMAQARSRESNFFKTISSYFSGPLTQSLHGCPRTENKCAQTNRCSIITKLTAKRKEKQPNNPKRILLKSTNREG